MNRYVCKKCGRFVSQNAETCKCCGTENPAVLKELTPKNQEDKKLIECPNCQNVFNPKSKINDEIVICPNCSCSISNPYCKKVNTNAIIFLICLLVLILAGYFMYDSPAPSSTKTNNEQAYVPEYHEQDDANPVINDEAKDAAKALVFKVNGSYDPEYAWVITSENGKFKFEYIIKDSFSDRQSVKSSGNCAKLSFGQLKKHIPGAVIRECAISTNQNILFLGPIETHYNLDGSERPVYGIIVMSSDSSGRIFLNDTDNPNEFIPLDNLTLEIR